MKSSRPSSAHWTSSKAMITGILLGEPLEEHAPTSEQLFAGEARRRDTDQRAQSRREELTVGGADDPAFKACTQFRHRLPLGGLLGDPKLLANHFGDQTE